MAWLFSMCVHASCDADADRLAAHFDGLGWVRADGRHTRCEVQRLAAQPTCLVIPDGLSRVGLAGEICGREFAEAAEHLYRRLEQAPPFAMALAGVEVDDGRNPSDIEASCRSDHPAWRGVVVPESTWRTAGAHERFEPFRPGYVWRPYEPIAERIFKAPIGSHPRVEGAEIVDRPGWYQVLADRPGPSGNEVTLSELAPDADLEARIDEVIEEYAARRTTFRWCVGPSTRPSDTGARLADRGFEHWGMRGMFWPPDAPLLAPSASVTVERVGLGELDLLIETMRASWAPLTGDHDYWKGRFGRCLEQPGGRFRFYVARLDGVPAGMAGTFLGGGLGYLIGGSVDPVARGRSVYRALVRARLAELREGGVRLAVTQAREATSAPILEYLGFETAYEGRIYRYPPPPSA